MRWGTGGMSGKACSCCWRGIEVERGCVSFLNKGGSFARIPVSSIYLESHLCGRGPFIIDLDKG